MKSISKTDSRKILKHIKASLECNICCNAMTGHVYQCKNGHIVCEDCTTKCKGCPYCKESFGTRNIFLENILENYVVTCPHHLCKHKCKNVHMKSHKTQCVHRPINCLFCKEKIHRSPEQIIKHLKTRHTADCCRENSADGRKSIRFRITTQNPIAQFTWLPQILAFDDSFFLIHAKATVNNVVVFALHLNQPLEEKNYNCQLCIKSSSIDVQSYIPILPTVDDWKLYSHLVVNKNITTTESDYTYFRLDIKIARNEL